MELAFESACVSVVVLYLRGLVDSTLFPSRAFVKDFSTMPWYYRLHKLSSEVQIMVKCTTVEMVVATLAATTSDIQPGEIEYTVHSISSLGSDS